MQLWDIWLHEALDFTKWLAEEPSLKLLSAAVGIERKLIETESSVRAFSVDIYAQETGTGRKVVTENQLAPTDHDHLDNVIIYAAGKGAEVVIWVIDKRATSIARPSNGSISTPIAISDSSWSRLNSGKSATRAPRRASTSWKSPTSGRRPSS